MQAAEGLLYTIYSSRVDREAKDWSCTVYHRISWRAHLILVH